VCPYRTLPHRLRVVGRDVAGASNRLLRAGRAHLRAASDHGAASCRPPVAARGGTKVVGRQNGDDFGVCLGRETVAELRELAAELLEFSMMPIWTTATRSVAIGCALVSFGTPCVAQRVWPMPIEPPIG
jgi:hypothetical protein